jgi:hypothetical protein
MVPANVTEKPQQFPIERRVLLAVSAYQRRGYRRKNGESERENPQGTLFFAPVGAALFGLMYGKEYPRTVEFGIAGRTSRKIDRSPEIT